MRDVVVKLEVHHKWTLLISRIEVEIANLGAILSQFACQVSPDHGIDSQLVAKRVKLFAELFFDVLAHELSSRCCWRHSDDKLERLTERISVVEVDQNILVDGLGANPVRSRSEHLTELDNVALVETDLLEEVAL